MIDLRKIFVVTLAEDTARQAHIREHLPTLGLGDFEFVTAVHHRDDSVRYLYDQGKVTEYPGCFRCGKPECECVNNMIIPQQVANWLSFIKVWERCSAYPEAYFLICEDDVSFCHGAGPVLRSFLESFEANFQSTLIRMAASGRNPNNVIGDAVYRLSNRVVMSNAAYILNGRMAQLLLETFDRIETTSDIWLHRDVANRTDVNAATIEPLLATDLSFNQQFARFASRIHPKGIDASDQARMKNHTKRVASLEEYHRVRASWFTS